MSVFILPIIIHLVFFIVRESTQAKIKEVGEEEKKEWQEKVLPFIAAQSVLAVLACVLTYLSTPRSGFTIAIVYLVTSVVSEFIMMRTTAQTELRKEKASLHNFLVLGILLVALIVYKQALHYPITEKEEEILNNNTTSESFPYFEGKSNPLPRDRSINITSEDSCSDVENL